MIKINLAPNEFLDNYILNWEFVKLAKISQNSYVFWKNGISASYQNSKTIFLHKDFIPKKYAHLVENCTNLDGFVLASAFCSFTGIANSHLVKSNKSNLYERLEIKSLGRLKFVNLKKLYDELGLAYNTYIYIEKCKYFSPLEKQIKLTKTLCLGHY